MPEAVSKTRCPLDRPNVVGIFHVPEESIDQGNNYLQGLDAVEFRLDLLERLPHRSELEIYRRPLIMTARHSEEGGNPHLNQEQRLQLLTEAMPLASFVDLELRFWNEAVSEMARKSDVRVIASFHDFSATPHLSELLEKSHQAKQLGADVFKVATHLTGPNDLACLLQLLAAAPIPVAAMGMGPLGMASRLALAHCGSVLNYGWLGRPFIAGQWSAKKFAERLKELGHS